jgi:hypothetical protein
VFVRREIEGEKGYYCHLDKTKRPPCMSLMMDEYPVDELEGKSREERKSLLRKMNREWDQWSMSREVQPWDICDDFRSSGNG